MRPSMSLPRPPVDLDNCAREPIHIPGSIQPHGVLLALDPENLRIVQWSTNAPDWLHVSEDELSSMRLDDLVDEKTVARVQRLVQKTAPGVMAPLMTTLLSSTSPGSVATRADESPGSMGFYLGTAHLYDGVLILEFEKRPTNQILLHSSVEEGTESITRCVQRATARLHACQSQRELFQSLAEEVRHLTGYDRVMVYRFMPDQHGVVEGEALRDGLESYFGLHYPASDIPPQARRLYTLNLIRVIADLSATAVPLEPPECPLTGRPLDLTYSSFRSVSPIHIEYLRNMGVAASMSISILNEGQLWGLIACHHYQPRNLSLEIRAACELLGSLAGSYVVTREISDEIHLQNERQLALAETLRSVAGEESIQVGIEKMATQLCQIVDAQGMALCWHDEIVVKGQTPPLELVEELRDWIRSHEPSTVWHTDQLAAKIGSSPRVQPDSTTVAMSRRSSLSHQLIDAASGVLVLQLSANHSDMLIFFRPQYVTEVHWAGNPDKSAQVTEDGLRLSPRKSFALWTQTVEAQSRPWCRIDQNMAVDMHAGLLRLLAQRSAELLRINEELLRVNSDLDSFAYAASHDLKEPLRTINQTIFFLERALKDQQTEEIQRRVQTIQRTTGRMTELLEGLLRVSRAGSSDLHLEPTRLEDVVRDAAELTLEQVAADRIVLTVHELPTIYVDFMCMRDVFQNLFSNARKYSTVIPLRIDVGIVDVGPEHSPPPQAQSAIGRRAVYVRDNGIGIATDRLQDVFQVFRRLHQADEFGGGSGVGLAIVKRVVERHGGVVWATSKAGTGSTFYFTLEALHHGE